MANGLEKKFYYQQEYWNVIIKQLKDWGDIHLQTELFYFSQYGGTEED